MADHRREDDRSWDRRRKCKSGSEESYKEKRSRTRKRKEEGRDGSRNNRDTRNPNYDSTSHRHRRHRSMSREDDQCIIKRKYHSRSRSPQDDPRRRRRRYSSESMSPERSPRHSREDRPSHHDQSISRSPPPKRRRHKAHDDHKRSSHHRRDKSASPPSKRSRAPLPSQQAAFTQTPSADSSTAITKPPPEPEKQKPNFAPTGKLAAETNTVANTSIILKYNEPPEARLPPPSQPWRLYIFKSSDLLETLDLHTRSCWLFGRERAVVDFPTEHPSCSKQHAVLQFRYVERRDEWGGTKGGVKLYVIDLESANGTRVNGERVPEGRYVEVRSGDVLRFGESGREYVVLLPPKE